MNAALPNGPSRAEIRGCQMPCVSGDGLERPSFSLPPYANVAFERRKLEVGEGGALPPLPLAVVQPRLQRARLLISVRIYRMYCGQSSKNCKGFPFTASPCFVQHLLLFY